MKPWLKWYPADWRADPGLRLCSLAARGLWIELLGYMHEAPEYGHLLIAGKAPSIKQIAGLVGSDLATVKRCLDELEDNRVFDREGDLIVSRRMVRDKAKAEQDRINGSGGGNPNLVRWGKGGVNPPDNQEDKAARGHAPASSEARNKKEDSGTSVPDGLAPSKAADPVKDMWDRGVAILGEKRRSLFAKYRQTYGDPIVLAAIVECETEMPSEPASYFVACCDRRKVNGSGRGSSASAVDKLGAWAMGEDEQEIVRGHH